MLEMLALPLEVVCECILPHLSFRDLQALDTAYTNKLHRPQLRQVWKSYQYDALDVELERYQIEWLRIIGVRIVFLYVESFWGGTYYDEAVTNIPTLKKMNFNADLCDKMLLRLAINWSMLEELHCKDVYGRETDNAVSSLAQNCRQLHTLHIKSEDLTDIGISALAQHCHHLRSVHIGDAQITDAGVQALCHNCPHLKHIGLSRCDSLTDVSLIAIANTYLHLQSIYLCFNKCIDDGLIYFASKCHELRSFNFLIEHRDITSSRGLTAIWAANPNLVDVDISRTDSTRDEDIHRLVQCCPLLEKLSLYYCLYVTDAAVIAMAEHCPQLRSLDISYCWGLSDAALIALGQHCHELKSINISGLQKITDVGIAALAAGCPLLQEFYASWCRFTDAGLVALAHECRDLCIVDIDCCSSISITGVPAIAENCPLLSRLIMYTCQIDDACLYSIAQHCRNLTCLEFGNTKVSNVAVVSVINSCRMFREMRCRKCFKNEEDKRPIYRSSRLREINVCL